VQNEKSTIAINVMRKMQTMQCYTQSGFHQSINHSTIQPTNQSLNRSIDQSTYKNDQKTKPELKP